MTIEESANVLSAFIPFGIENAITGKDLMKKAGLPDDGLLRACIRNLRKSGVKIASGQFGYFIPRKGESADELAYEETIRKFEQQGAEMLLTAQMMRQEG